MTTRSAVVLTVVAVCFGSLAWAQQAESPDPPLVNWTAPPYWTLPAAEQAREHLTGTKTSPENHWASPEATATPVPTTILPFTAVTPCRLYDSRANAPFTGDSTFNTDGQTELFDFFSTATPPYAATVNPNGCTLPTAGTVGAWSLKFTYRTSSASQGYLTAYPGNITRPFVGTILGVSDQQTSGAAIVPAGTDADNTINVYAQYAANTMVIDYNGYFAAQPVVTGITNGSTTLTGDVTLGAGSNIAITPSGNTFTIAMTGVAGGTLPSGTLGQTLYSNGSGWLANSFLYNSGSAIGIGTTTPGYQLDLNGMMNMPATTATSGTATAGVLFLGGTPFLHNYAAPGSWAGNTFLGQGAGNFTMGGTNSTDASFNTADGFQSLHANTVGADNTAVGYQSLYSNTMASKNTAIGSGALYSLAGIQMISGPYDSWNTAVGYQALYSDQPTNYGNGITNTAVGAQSLYSNTIGQGNSAIGSSSLYKNTTGSNNTADGAISLSSNTVGIDNTAVGVSSLQSNTEGYENTATGLASMQNNRSGYRNTAYGAYSLGTNAMGFDNIALGYNAGATVYGNWNIDIGNQGAGDESNTIRIGDTNQTRTFIAGINGATVSGAAVLVDATTGQLGVASSSLRFKQDVVDMGDASSRLMELRPVTFHYKAHRDGPLQYGLIAEEVNEVMPELVVRDATGQVETVAYHELPAMLLNELQKQRATIQVQQARIETQQAQIEALVAHLAAVEAQLAAK